jgi:hypothetical protein
MVIFFYLEEDDSGKNPIIVQAIPDDKIYVPRNYIPIPFDPEEHVDSFGQFHNVLIDDEDDRRDIYILIHIDELYSKLMESGDLSNMELALIILDFHNKEGWVWNIDTQKLEKCPNPDRDCHRWVHHTQSWETECKICFKPKCHSVEILSKKVLMSRLKDLYCHCERCEECGSIYDDDECTCHKTSTQKQSYASSNSHLVICEHCGRKYDAFDCTSLYIHDGRCC